MDNNTPKGDNNEKKPYHKKYNHHRRRPSGAQQSEPSDSSPNGQVIVRGGRYDLPPSAQPENASSKAADKPSDKNESASKPLEAPKPEDKSNGADLEQSSVNQRDERDTRRPRRPRPNHNRKGDHAEQSRKADEDNESSSEEKSADKPSDSRKNRRSRGGRRKSHRSEQLLSEKEALILDELADSDGDTEADNAEDSAADANDAAPITAAEPEVESVSEITLTANSDPTAPSESEIIEELNSTDDPGDAPGIENTDASESESVPSDSEVEADSAEPEAPVATLEIIGVKFKSTGKIYYFDPCGFKFRRADTVVVDTARGLEFGTVELANRMVTEREVVLPLRKVVRRATDDDIARNEANAARAAEALLICGEKIAEHKLDMKLVDVEYTFDNSKLLFYFTADGRVDFRELVKDLASVFRTRIELRQIGIRDETKLLGGIGICGRPFCCKTFLSDFVQVSIKMAKEQSLSLNSAKISGACGRLMCCLRYEYDTYAEEIRKTPKVDQIVTTPDGEGLVIEVQPLAGLVRVRFTDGQDTPPKVFHRDDVTVIGGKGVKNKPQGNANMN